MKHSKILVVDDIVENIQLKTNILKNRGYPILFAKPGSKALKVVSKNNLSLILLDIEMPIIDSYEVAQQLYADERYWDIPLIFLTASSSAKDIQI